MENPQQYAINKKSTCEYASARLKQNGVIVLNKKLISYIDRFRASIYPDRCCLCGKVIEYKTKVCKDCRKEAKTIRGDRCLACGVSKKNCSCKKKSNFYNGITAPFVYEGVVRKGIQLWKFQGAERNVSFFAEMIAASINESFDDIQFDVITFVPQTEEESAERTYNQSEQLAAEVGKSLNLPVTELLKKIYETDSQRNLHPSERSGNVFGVFECIHKDMIQGKNILLIDDVKTSGATINECAKMLHLYDATNVYCAVIAVV